MGLGLAGGGGALLYPKTWDNPPKEYKLRLKEFFLEVLGVKGPVWDRESWGQPQVHPGREGAVPSWWNGGDKEICPHLGAEGAFQAGM